MKKLSFFIVSILILGMVNSYVFAEDWKDKYDMGVYTAKDESYVGENENGYYILDKDGNELSGPYKEQILPMNDKDRFLSISEEFRVNIIDGKGNKIFDNDYSYVHEEVDGKDVYIVSLFGKEDSYGIVDKYDEGNVLLPFEYSMINFNYGTGYYEIYKKVNGREMKGYSDGEKVMIPAEYDDIILSDKIIAYRKNYETNENDYFVYDNGEMNCVKSMPYELYKSNHDGTLIIKAADSNDIPLYGCVDDELDILIEPIYNNEPVFADKYGDYTNCCVLQTGSNGKSYEIRHGREVIPVYDGTYGVIDLKEGIIVPFEYDKIEMLSEYCFYCEKYGESEYILRDDISFDGSGWAKESVMIAMAKRFIPEEIQNDYKEDITRGEFCRLAVRTYMATDINRVKVDNINDYINVNELQTDKSMFNDTNDEYILLANRLGIVSGRGEGIFAPNDRITRQEAAVMLVNMAKALNMNVSAKETEFTDNNYFADWAKNEIYTVSNIKDKNGLAVMSGTGDGKFSPWMNYSREQAIATMLRLSDCYEEQTE
ncbi:MAG: S-layer homology domain-containing protein [Firmicutes bacterium]|nr:S-layer homology domain-containing protein [Bacillota bacterium]